MNYALVIPCRYDSSRLPGKPLLDLDGVPMIVRTYRQCLKAVPAERIFVATDDSRIIEVCKNNGIQTVKTGSNCLTGTDRVAEASEVIEADYFLNVQGDEPVFEPGDILRLLDVGSVKRDEVLNGFCEISSENIFRSHNVPKVVTRQDGRLLYMSRAPIPAGKTGGFVQAWRQVCAYLFPRSSLTMLRNRESKSRLESIEDIEILSFLEVGIDVRMVHLSDKSISVDVPEDIPLVLDAIRSRGL